MERLVIVLLMVVISTLRVVAIPPEQFYPFGTVVGDRSLVSNDDDSTEAITMRVPFPFFDKDHDTLFVNNNGLISFNEKVSAFTPDSFPVSNQGLIAPFWADVDTRSNGGIVYYRDSADPGLLARTKDEIQEAFVSVDDFYPISLFIATWDHVGYYNSHSDKTNTFQCILATDGLQSFVMFLYADSEIQWTTGDQSGGQNGVGGTPAQVGFDAGDGVRFASVPGSQRDEIINIDQTSNIGRPGVWMFRVDEEEVSFAGCIDNSTVTESRVALSPNYGSVLGGQSVIVTGPCFQENDNISCSFGGFDVDAVFINKFWVLCVSPALPHMGRIDFKLHVNKYVGDSIFIALSIEQSYQVDVSLTSDNSLLFTDGDEIETSWDPAQIFPLLPPSNYTVDISAYILRDGNGQWFPSQVLLMDNVANSGMQRVTVRMPDSDDVYPIAVQVSVHTADLTTLDSYNKYILERLDPPAGKWSAQFYYADDAVLSRGRSLCYDWSNNQHSDIANQLLNSVTPCPPTTSRASLPNSGVTEENYISFLGNTLYSTQWRSYFHPGTSVCYRQRLVSERREVVSTPTQHCCYDDSGDLVIGPKGGGSVYRSSPDISPVTHFASDIRPRILCCKTALPSCQTFFDLRPSDDGSRYDPPPPAWMFGDPHIVTLDGLRYTFNGLGEFTLLETTDSSLTVQGRMEQATDSIGETVNATVFTAIVAQTSDSDTVQFQTSRRGIDALVNGERVLFGVIHEIDFENVTVTSLEDATLSASFAGGLFIQVTLDNGFLSSLIISIPVSYKWKTQGLLGAYNGYEADDFLPKGSNISIAANSTVQEIHNLFGNTWIINSTMDSLFTYRMGESLAFFNDVSFVPDFEPTFTDPIIEQQANAVCSGDIACLFDIATTGNINIGLSTLNGSQNVETVNQLSMPVVCDIPCDNGVCVDNNRCKCAVGFSGESCTEPVYSECDNNPCENGGTCVTHAGSLICTCHNGYSGINCEDGSPRLSNDIIIVIGASIAGAAVVLLISSGCVITVIIVRWKHRQKNKRKQDTTKANDPAYEDSNKYSTVASDALTPVKNAVYEEIST